MNHYPFDDGALAYLGALTGQKTIKAFCGKRVTFDAEVHTQRIDCPACRTALARRRDDTLELMRHSSVTEELKNAAQRTIDMIETVLAR